MRINSIILFHLIAFCSANTLAEVYQCELNGKTTYSQTPCIHNEKQTIRQENLISLQPTPESQQLSKLQHQKDIKESKRLEDARHRTEAKRDREIKKNVAKADKQKEKCDYLQLQVKWAKDDLANSPPKAESKARSKLKKANEKANFFCGER